MSQIKTLTDLDICVPPSEHGGLINPTDGNTVLECGIYIITPHTGKAYTPVNMWINNRKSSTDYLNCYTTPSAASKIGQTRGMILKAVKGSKATIISVGNDYLASMQTTFLIDSDTFILSWITDSSFSGMFISRIA